MSYRNAVVKRKPDPYHALPDSTVNLSIEAPDNPIMCLSDRHKKMKLNPQETQSRWIAIQSLGMIRKPMDLLKSKPKQKRSWGLRSKFC